MFKLSAILAIILVAAVGTGVVATSQTVRDPENPAFAGNTIDATTDTGSRVVRDPENPYWNGASLSSTAGGSAGASGLK